MKYHSATIDETFARLMVAYVNAPAGSGEERLAWIELEAYVLDRPSTLERAGSWDRLARWCSEILGKVSRLLDTIAPPFTAPDAIEDAVASVARLDSRLAPKNCRHEPHYPDAATFTFSIRYPDLVCHHATEACPTDAPHDLFECQEFDWRSWRVPCDT